MQRVLAGVDLGGTSIKAAIADESGAVLAQRSAPTESHRGPLAVLTIIGDLVETLAAEAGAQVQAIGVGVPGLIDIDSGVTRFLPNFTTHWRNVPVGPTLAKRFDCPVRLLNDVRTATLGELRFGHGKERPHLTLLFFALGTGVGGGVVVDGVLRRGPLGAAGELGHMVMEPQGAPCGCGSRGCLETISSGPAIAAEGVRLLRTGMAPKLHELVGGNADRISTKEMAEAAAEGDNHVALAITRAAEVLGLAAANLVSALHPDLVVLGGGVAEMGEPIFGPVRRVIREQVKMFPTDNVQVEPSLLKDKAGVLGAIALAQEAAAEAAQND
ncbi:ROK family protein [Lignipirellula cremea]|uniref:Glucokinase n=1 Tax=Lignipirellula cremea TaxID=2528010 RepID=A0A518E3K3_9BACT|nr:ROK family protein [Lignipirellula cremea]QDU98669.1 Glucokinase [Lignipirellula cremea]